LERNVVTRKRKNKMTNYEQRRSEKVTVKGISGIDKDLKKLDVIEGAALERIGGNLSPTQKNILQELEWLLLSLTGFDDSPTSGYDRLSSPFRPDSRQSSVAISEPRESTSSM
jgi:hypothetical protein